MRTFRLEKQVDRASWWRLLTPAALVLVIIMAYLPALMAGYVEWDDDKLVSYNRHIENISWDNVKWMWTTSFGGHFHPLTWWSYTVDFALWGPDAFLYHLTNVQWHILTALAFYFVARRLIWEGTNRTSDRRNHRTVIAAGLAALWFAVHPLRVESVAWIAERRDVLSGFFYVTSIWLYLRYVAFHDETNPLPTRQSKSLARVMFVLSIISCMVSLLAKASAMTLPLVLLAIDRFPLRRHVPRAHHQRIHLRHMILEKLPFLLIAILAGVRAIIAQEEGGALYTMENHDALARIAQACYGLVFYLQKTLLPFGLGPLYPIPSREILLGSMFFISGIILFSTVVASIWLRKKVPALLAVLAVYAVSVSPVLGIAQSGPQLVADRYSYLSCMGFAVFAGAGVLQVFNSRWWRDKREFRYLAALMLVSISTILTQATIVQCYYWSSDHSLWQRGVKISPNSAIAHTNYADALKDRLKSQDAAKHYQQALELDPKDVVALHHFGDLQRDAGYTEAAIQLYFASLRIDPNRGRASFSLAQLLLGKNREKDAVVILYDTVRRHPEYLKAKTYLANVLSMHPDEAIRNGEQATKLASSVVRRTPYNPIALMTLATAQAESNQFDLAIDTIQRAMILAEKHDEDRLLRELSKRLEKFLRNEPIRIGP